ncbi:hypothetical protein D9613_011783 [Agrocybe pediades]|uniref:Uncharacterized protein n=1 Tax=Agrocybe pediades TaxID=84607 RepID=A0A8H4VLY9_9AGAR|nr:hypothetical protein D9613_011783 [Agrocybe pediades]
MSRPQRSALTHFESYHSHLNHLRDDLRYQSVKVIQYTIAESTPSLTLWLIPTSRRYAPSTQAAVDTLKLKILPYDGSTDSFNPSDLFGHQQCLALKVDLAARLRQVLYPDIVSSFQRIDFDFKRTINVDLCLWRMWNEI